MPRLVDAQYLTGSEAGYRFDVWGVGERSCHPGAYSGKGGIVIMLQNRNKT